MATVKEWHIFVTFDRTLDFGMDEDTETMDDFENWAYSEQGMKIIWEKFFKNIRFSGPQRAYMIIESVDLIEHEVKSTDTDESV